MESNLLLLLLLITPKFDSLFLLTQYSCISTILEYCWRSREGREVLPFVREPDGMVHEVKNKQAKFLLSSNTFRFEAPSPRWAVARWHTVPPRNTSFAHVSRFLEGMQARIGGGGIFANFPLFGHRNSGKSLATCIDETQCALRKTKRHIGLYRVRRVKNIYSIISLTFN